MLVCITHCISVSVVVVVRLEHSHSFIDNHFTASGPASCRRRMPPGNAVSELCALWSGCRGN